MCPPSVNKYIFVVVITIENRFVFNRYTITHTISEFQHFIGTLHSQFISTMRRMMTVIMMMRASNFHVSLLTFTYISFSLLVVSSTTVIDNVTIADDMNDKFTEGIDNNSTDITINGTKSPTKYSPQPNDKSWTLEIIWFSLIFLVLFIVMITNSVLTCRKKLVTRLNRTNNTSTSTTTKSKPLEKSIEDRKQDFDTLPKMYYNYDFCSYSKRKLMIIEYLTIEQGEKSSSATITENPINNDHEDIEASFQNANINSNHTINKEIKMMVRYDNLEIASNLLEITPKDINHDDIENVQEYEGGDIVESASTDNLRSSRHQLSSFYDEGCARCYNNDDNNNDHYHEECLICCEEYKSNEIVVILPQCFHMYHVRCLEQWFIHKKSNLCPLCKTFIIVDIESSL